MITQTGKKIVGKGYKMSDFSKIQFIFSQEYQKIGRKKSQ
jgi:hypothetical protein